jgi:hypothetical protein
MSLWLTDPGLRVVEESDRFFLEADEFEPLSQAAAVREAAARLLPRINGVGKLKSASFQDVGLGLVQEDDSGTVRKHAFLRLDAIRIRSRVSPVVIRVGDEQAEPSVPGAQESDAWVRAAASHPNKQRALALWAGPHDPTSLWKVWELVRESGMTIDSDERRRFRPALNDRAISGEDARHDVSRRYPAEPDTPGVLSDTRRDRPAPERSPPQPGCSVAPTSSGCDASGRGAAAARARGGAGDPARGGTHPCRSDRARAW